MQSRRTLQALLASAVSGTIAFTAIGSSHREAPFVTEHPKVDATDFYLFNSYEPGREDYVTIIANYLPLQTPGGGPNYFAMDPDASYDIHIATELDGKTVVQTKHTIKTLQSDTDSDKKSVHSQKQ